LYLLLNCPQFIDERLDMMNSGQGFSDEFELEAALHGAAPDAKGVHGAALKEWMGSVKKEGGNLIKSVKTKANPAVKSAVKSVREKGKTVKQKGQSAVRDIKSKLHGDKDGGASAAAGGGASGTSHGPGHRRSAPSSPTSFRRSKKGSFEFRKTDRLISYRKPTSDVNLCSK
jgi:hypothetical protein